MKMKLRFLTTAILLTAVCAYASAISNKTKLIMKNVESIVAPDKRQIVYDIKAKDLDNGRIILTGKTSEASAADALKAALRKKGIRFIDKIEIFGNDQWALPRISVANLRSKPGHSAELASQALMGMPLRLLENEGDWWRVQTPDGYIAWVVDNSLTMKSADDMRRWRDTPRAVVTSIYQTRCYNSPDAIGLRDVVSDLVNGNIVEVIPSKPQSGRTEIMLPDGRKAWVATSDITPIEVWASQDYDAEKILDMAYSMEGQPYLWGGTSTKSLDCSGLAKVCYLSNGIILRRDASQQALTGKRIEASDWKECRAGDLLFFGNATTGRVTHVAIYDSNGNYVHSSGRVKRNSVDPKSSDYLSTPFLHCVRIAGNEGRDGITRVRDHNWYFNL